MSLSNRQLWVIVVVVAQLVGTAEPFAWAQSSSATSGDGELEKRIAAEIESIIPRKYGAGSEEKQIVSQIAEACVQGKNSRVVSLLEDLANKDSSVPPQNLILAGISFATNNPVQGRNLLERVGADFRDHPGVALAFSRLALMQGRYYEAFALASKANQLASNPMFDETVRKFYSVEAHNSMTVIEMRRNDMDRAEEMARAWSKLDPTSDELLLASAEISFKRQLLGKSVELLDKRSAEAKATLPSEVIMAKWCRAKSEYQLLETWVKKAYQTYPENPVVQLEYASWLLRTGKYEGVEKIVASFESKNGPSLDSMSLMGRVAFGRGDYQKAVEIFGNIFGRQPNNFENSSVYIFSLLETDSPENQRQANSLAQRNYQAFPNSQLAILAMSYALRKAGNAEVSGQLLERAARAGNILPDTAYFMASKLNDEGRGLQAKIMLDSFMESLDMFLYRERAQQLIDSIGGNEGSLPVPSSKAGK